MKVRPPVVIGLALVTLVCIGLLWNYLRPRGDSENAKKIIGVWEDTEGAPIRIEEFRKDGAFILTIRARDGTVLHTAQGTFKVSGDTLAVKTEDASQTVTIKKLTEQELEFQMHDEAKTVNRLRRVN